MTYYRNIVTLYVLSDEDIASWPIGSILEACDTGPCVLANTALDVKELDGRAMAEALTAAGSEPGFFQLDEDGNSEVEDG